MTQFKLHDDHCCHCVGRDLKGGVCCTCLKQEIRIPWTTLWQPNEKRVDRFRHILEVEPTEVIDGLHMEVTAREKNQR